MLSVAVSPTGGIIASGSKDRTVRLWAPNMYRPLPSPTIFPASLLARLHLTSEAVRVGVCAVQRGGRR